jgi:hypothetical protein
VTRACGTALATDAAGTWSDTIVVGADPSSSFAGVGNCDGDGSGDEAGMFFTVPGDGKKLAALELGVETSSRTRSGKSRLGKRAATSSSIHFFGLCAQSATSSSTFSAAR